MTDLDLTKLREIAEAAMTTPGPWSEYLLAFDPPTVIALIDEIERLKAQIPKPRAEPYGRHESVVTADGTRFFPAVKLDCCQTNREHHEAAVEWLAQYDISPNDLPSDVEIIRHSTSIEYETFPCKTTNTSRVKATLELGKKPAPFPTLAMEGGGCRE